MAEETWKNYKEQKHYRPQPLKGIRVLEVCTLILGPSGPGFSATMGAEVIKCEIPPLGDTCRDMTPFGHLFRGYGPVFVRNNINKYWIGLDLHKPEAQKVFLELASRPRREGENISVVGLYPKALKKLKGERLGFPLSSMVLANAIGLGATLPRRYWWSF